MKAVVPTLLSIGVSALIILGAGMIAQLLEW